MKKSLIPAFICAIFFLMLAVSCSEKEGKSGVRAIFEVVQPERINSRFDGQAFKLTIKTNVDWGVIYDEGSDWFAVMPDLWMAYFDEPETLSVDLVTELNDFPTPRSGRCWIVPKSGRRFEINVTQDGNPDPE